MGLVLCFECGAKVSRYANDCPHCGASKPGATVAGSIVKGLAIGGAAAALALSIALLLSSSGGKQPDRFAEIQVPDSVQEDQATQPNGSAQDIATPALHYADIWTEMKENPGSPELAAYVAVAEPIDLKIGNAGAILRCGLRNAEWYSEVTRRLEEYRAGPAVAPVFNRLSEGERAQAFKFDKAVVDARMQMTGGNFERSACEALAAMPFVYSDDAFRPGPYVTP